MELLPTAAAFDFCGSAVVDLIFIGGFG